MRYLVRSCLVAGLAWSVFSWSQNRPLRHPPGVLVAAEPVQKDCAATSIGSIKGYAVTAVASYEIKARVLHTKHYWVDHNDLVPYDVAMGWGRMSDQAVLDSLAVSQSNRFFFYQWASEPPIPEDEIISHAANVHVIAATREVASVVSGLRAGQLVDMRGYLVNVTGPNGFFWHTSLRRDDTGNGACELFYVESIKALEVTTSFAGEKVAAQSSERAL